jgi:hypothetical protein
MKNILKATDACFVNYCSFQDRLFYDASNRRQTNCHNEEMEGASKRHSEGKMMDKQKHLMEIYTEMQKHFQTLNSDLLSTTKENGILTFLYSAVNNVSREMLIANIIN